MAMLLVMLVGLALTRQEPGPQVAPSTTLPSVEVVAPYANEGTVVVECRANPDGSLKDCIIISETPRGQGFGRAALQSTRRSRLSASSVEAAGADATVRFTVRFRLPD